ncbi:MFS transporter [Marimonas lutisalis]|uniref:MFS transporter n=1 Tax=Marimonas lutisalis TaxID=2545756 RepID=UPI0010F8E013|nr:MFS transporter [Marimonas lutisalis]
MFERRIPEWLRHAPAPSVRGFALINGFEAVTRGLLISVFPVALYDALGDARTVSALYFGIGIVSLLTGLLVPFIGRFIPRRWIYITGTLLYILGAVLAASGAWWAMPAAVLLYSMATVITFVCFNAYVLDYIARIELGRCETLRMFYSALGWTAGPLTGVALVALWRPAPFLLSGLSACFMLGAFLYMRLGNGRLITRAKRPPPNPLAFLGRFFAQPRLVAGWLFAVIRSCGWWAYVVYLPIFALENDLGQSLGGALLSVTNAALFLSPLMLRWMQARSVRHAVRTGFFFGASLFLLASLLAPLPVAAVAALFGASLFLILLDISAGLPFLMAVKPSERTEMSAIYSSFRDVSGILTPGIAWAVLMVAPLAGIFTAAGVAMASAWMIAGRLHPRLGSRRITLEPAE